MNMVTKTQTLLHGGVEWSVSGCWHCS